jgi:glucan endo-1,3-beta-D-glucosidase
MRFSRIVSSAASLSVVSATCQGFNYGATKADGYVPREQADFQSLFSTAKNLVGTNGGFTSARLYTTIQAGTENDVTSAIPAAIAEGTKLLLGIWASGSIANELTAIENAIKQYGSSFTDLVVAISCGSEDLYRNSPTGIAAGSTVGAEPQAIVDCITQVRSLISGTGLSGAPVGHVDTWTAWVNGTNQPVIDASDWIGMDAYPYFQNTMTNDITDGSSLFDDALAVTQAAVGSKEVWITETGWPVSGKTENLAVPSTANAKTYWDQVGCPRFGNVNIFWYTIEDTDDATPNPSFGVTSGKPLSTTPLYDLSCANISSSSSSSASSSATTLSLSGSVTKGSSTATGTAVKSGSSSVATGALTPSEGPGSGYGSGSNATVTGSSGSGSGSSGNSTGLATTAKPTGTSPSTSAITQATANAGATVSGSVVGILGAFLAAIAVL